MSEEQLRVIRGDIPPEEKKKELNNSLENWWKEYSHRKNHEEDDMVANTLLYDERCHLPRTAAGPKPEPEPEVTPPLANGQANGHQ